MDIVKLQESLEAIIEKNQDLIGAEAKNLKQEYALKSAQEMKEDIEKIDRENRLLQIGILGRVNAGKSSLLNALLFDGKSILPKAATPMTAALAIISYGDELSAEVEFFKKEDIENIKQEAQEYKRLFENFKKKALEDLKNKKAERNKSKEKKGLLDKAKDTLMEFSPTEIKELEEQAEKRAKREIKSNMSLSASFDQWERIEASNVNYLQLPESKTVSSSSLENLSQELLNYVGSDGEYMPFTKSVHIRIPQENLKGIQIVDTPGVNDPVQSREERTRELLKFCDVVFVVSPSGQFMSNEDLELMDRITSKEGIRELYVIASQADLQLFGSIKEKSNGDLHQAFSHITSTLAIHLNNTLTKLKETNPEIGTTHDELIDQSRKKIVHSSGICLVIKEYFEKRELWDEGVNTAWRNLTTHYPDYFSDSDKKLSISNLDLLANIPTISNIVQDVKNKKESILEARKKEYIEAKLNSLRQYQQKLLAYIEERIESIKSGSVEDLKERQQTLFKIKESVSDLVDEEYFDTVKLLEVNIKNKLMAKLKSYFRDAKNDVDNAEKIEQEAYEKYVGRGGFLWLKKKYETRYRDVTTVRTGAVRSTLEDLTYEIEDSIETMSISYLKEWKKSLSQSLLKVLRDNVDDEDLDIYQIRKVIRNILNSIKYPDIKYSGNIPSSLSANGTLKNSRAEEFISNAQNYISSLHGRVRDDIDSYLKELLLALNSIEVSQAIFGSYDEMLKQLEEEVSNKEITLDKLDRAKDEIGKVN